MPRTGPPGSCTAVCSSCRISWPASGLPARGAACEHALWGIQSGVACQETMDATSFALLCHQRRPEKFARVCMAASLLTGFCMHNRFFTHFAHQNVLSHDKTSSA